jgi:hypothetical protein
VTLLAKAAISEDEILPAYPKILAELSATEAELLDFIWRERDGASPMFVQGYINLYVVMENYGWDWLRAETYSTNVVRLGLWMPAPLEISKNEIADVAYQQKERPRRLWHDGEKHAAIHLEHNRSVFELTPLGINFMLACSN